jgi:MHS family proline/betaine transporter-like MFS transporter
MALTSHAGAAVTQPASVRIVAAASIGNALEWFDILVYGYLAVTISRLFFPADNEVTSLLLGLGTFGSAYLMRPLGAIVLGAYADRAGRKASLTISILLMTIGTLAMALMPTYQMIGIAAPIGVLLARLMQGFSVGGEFGSSTAFLAEYGQERKGFFASFQWVGQGFAAVLASAFGVFLTTALTLDELYAWGWRLPYIFGLLIGPVGFYIRRHLDETPEFRAAKRAQTPVADVIIRQYGRLLLAAGAVVISTSANYLILYMPTYAIKELGLSSSTGFIATLIGGLILTFGSPVAGHWSDSAGRIRIMATAAALFALTAYPAFFLLKTYASLTATVLVVSWLSLLKTAYSGVLPSLMAEIFPTQTRGTGMALSYNIAVPVFGGFAPFFATVLISLTGDKLAPSYYLVLTALLSLGVLIAIRSRLSLR